MELLVDVSDIFLLLRGGEGGAREGGGRFFFENPQVPGGGVVPGEGGLRVAGRVSAENWRGGGTEQAGFSRKDFPPDIL